MTVDRAWVKRNLGFDPIAKPAPAATFEFAPAARPLAEPDDLPAFDRPAIAAQGADS